MRASRVDPQGRGAGRAGRRTPFSPGRTCRARLYTTACHDDFHVDPDDTYMLDDVVRFVGQRVAAVVADSEGGRGGGLPAAGGGLRGAARPCSIPRRPCAPARRCCTTRAPESPHPATRAQHRRSRSHGEHRRRRSGIRRGGCRSTRALYATQRVQHAHLETHGSIAWRDADGRLHVRTSTQTPFLTRRASSCYLFGLYPQKVRVFCERVGGGFGGKQEMLTEDLCVLAALKTGRPVKLGVHARRAVHRGDHAPPDDGSRSRPAREADGTLTAMQMRIVSNTGRLRQPRRRGALSRLRRVDRRLSLPEQEGRRLRGLHQHGAGRRVPRLRHSRRPVFAVESAIDELARALGMDPIEFRRRNVVRAGRGDDVRRSRSTDDVDYGSYGLDQCLDLVRARCAAAATATALPPAAAG